MPMPRPKGFEPYSIYWQVGWRVYGGAVDKSGFPLHSFPNVALTVDEPHADSLVASLNAIALQATPLRVVPFSTFKVRVTFFNKKEFVARFVGGLAQTVSVSD